MVIACATDAELITSAGRNFPMSANLDRILSRATEIPQDFNTLCELDTGRFYAEFGAWSLVPCQAFPGGRFWT